MSVSKDLVDIIKSSDNKSTKAYDTSATVTRIDGDTAWVHIPGGVDETPVKRTINAKDGDIVQVRVSGGSAWINGNASAPPTDDATAIKATTIATEAYENAIIASQAAESATKDAAAAQVAAINAETSASNAEASATTAASSASDASISAANAAISASSAQADASTAATQASNAATSASNAETSASNASTSASNAAASAATAASQAAQAESDAAAANRAATEANTSANSALASLSVVEDVLGMAQWIAEHGTYTLTSDTSIVDGKVYFTRTGTGTAQDPYVYTPVANPDASELSTYYELSLDEEVSNYISTHLALTNDGLFIIKDNNGYKLKLTNNGAYILNDAGTQVAAYGASTTIGQVASGLYNTYIDNNGVNIRLNQTTIAKFGSTTTIGKYDGIGDSQWEFSATHGVAKFCVDENGGVGTPFPYDQYGFYIDINAETGNGRWSFGAPLLPTRHGDNSVYLGVGGAAYGPRSTVLGVATGSHADAEGQIGRASCRERV